MRAIEHSALGDLHSSVSCMRMAWTHRPARAYPLTATHDSVKPVGAPESPAGSSRRPASAYRYLLVRFALRRVQGQHLVLRHPLSAQGSEEAVMKI